MFLPRRLSRGWTLVPIALAVLIGVVLLTRSPGSSTPSKEAAAKPFPEVYSPDFPGAYVQVVAHPDDDLYFINPEIEKSIDHGSASTTIYLTAGEADGWRAPSGSKQKSLDRQQYATARQNGLRQAYAEMAAGDRNAKWERSTLKTRAGLAEVDTLASKPRVRLVFLNMLDGGGHVAKEKQVGLRQLWEGAIPSMPTLIPAGGPVKKTYDYTKDALVGTLTDLYAQFAPTSVRTLDPDPETHVYSSEPGKGYVDHQDHTAAALFAQASLADYQGPGNTRRVVVTSFRGYANAFWPSNLAAGEFQRKKSILDIYGGGDPSRCSLEFGCGDRNVGTTAEKSLWPQTTYARYPVTPTWSSTLPDGRLTAFAVLDGQVSQWTETKPGSGAWGSPSFVGGGWLAPTLSVAKAPDGRLRLVGLRTTFGPTPQAQKREIVTAAQTTPGGKFGPWSVLGNPDAADPQLARTVGVPAVALNQDGRLSVFVRNGARGLSGSTEQADGTWTAWANLGGSDLQDGLATVTTRAGRIEVFASTKTGMAHWAQAKPNAALAADPTFRAPVVSSAPTAVVEADGRIGVYVRRSPDSAVIALRQTAPEGGWAPEPRDLGVPGGTGTVAVTPRADGRVALAVRNNGGGVSSTVAAPDRDPLPLRWNDDGRYVPYTPLATTDSTGRAVLLALGQDGRLLVTRQQDPAPAAAFGTWVPIGN